jgi:single-strand DNA-binding protein
MTGISLTVAGNLGGDPELRYSAQGRLFATFTIASTERIRGDDGAWRDGTTSWVRAVAWGDLAGHVAETLQKGDRVLVTGTVKQREHTARDGTSRTDWELSVTDAAPSLLFATAQELDPPF